MKQYLGISRDHSGSMQSLTAPAIKDYNDVIRVSKEASLDNNIDTIVSVVTLGNVVHREIINSGIKTLKPLMSYKAVGGTTLYDSIGELIELFKAVPDYENPDVTFLIISITDGEENTFYLYRHDASSRCIALPSAGSFEDSHGRCDS